MAITCAEILDLPGLEQIQLRAGLQGANRSVRWPYCVESDSMEPWVEGGELVFISGIHYRRNEHNLMQLVNEAVANNISGLVILTGPQYIKQIPARVIELANRVGMPLFEQPFELKLVQVTETISNAIIQADLLGQSTRLFLTRLIHGYGDAPELIRLKARELGLDAQHPYCTLLFRLSESAPETSRAELETQLHHLLKRRGINSPVLTINNDLVLIWPVDLEGRDPYQEALATAIERVAAQCPDQSFFVGASDLHSGLEQLSDAVEQSRQAALFGVQSTTQTLVFFNQLGIARLFGSIPNRKLLDDFCRQYLGELCFCTDEKLICLRETLSKYLTLMGNQQLTAEALGIHRNTLRQRLSRIEQKTGQHLNDPFARLNLQNALLIEQVILNTDNLH